MEKMQILLAEVMGASIGIRATMDDMKTIHIDRIDGPKGDYGHDGVAEAFQSFCDRWQNGVSALLSDTDLLADALDMAVISYAQTDQDSARKLGIPIVPE
jgi:hypothetical protein